MRMELAAILQDPPVFSANKNPHNHGWHKLATVRDQHELKQLN